MKNELEYIGYFQEFHGEAEPEQNYKKENVYINAQKKRIIISIIKHLNQLDEPKIGVERRVILTKFRCFVISEDQYY